MSDEMDRRLREAGHRLPAPGDSETAGVRARFVAAAPTPRRRRKPILAALALAVLVGGAFGGGYAVAAGGNPKPKLIVKHVPARLNAGPGFLPAPGWSTIVALDPQTGAITSARVTKLSTSGHNGTVRIDARFDPASTKGRLQQRLLPLQLPPGGRVRHLLGHVGAYAVDVTITFASAHPSLASLVAAREELGRLVVPACPATRSLTAGDVAAAKRFLLGWLPAHYDGDATGATATAYLGKASPRYGEAAHDCGRLVATRSIEVDVVLPKLAKVSASLSQLTYFVAKTSGGWTVWERAR
jgi:hypothetical protein